MKHLLSIEKLTRADIEKILQSTAVFKKERGRHRKQPLAGQTWAMIFSKASTRTRVSFEVGIRELGGEVMFLSANEIQLGRGEPIKDTARVMGRMIHGCVIRTYAQSDVEEFAEYSNIPTINALTDEEHPCQILTDIYSIQEKRGPIAKQVVTFVGDGACNVANSWVFAAAKLGFELRIAAPAKYQPPLDLLDRAGAVSIRGTTGRTASGFPTLASFESGGKVIITDDIAKGAKGADVLYTDVWVSMGKEAESAKRLKRLHDYQVNAGMLKMAAPDAMVMHCLPAYRGKEIDADTFEAHAPTIFDQAENRLHTQKAIISWMVS